MQEIRTFVYSLLDKNKTEKSIYEKLRDENEKNLRKYQINSLIFGIIIPFTLILTLAIYNYATN